MQSSAYMRAHIYAVAYYFKQVQNPNWMVPSSVLAMAHVGNQTQMETVSNPSEGDRKTLDSNAQYMALPSNTVLHSTDYSNRAASPTYEEFIPVAGTQDDRSHYIEINQVIQ